MRDVAGVATGTQVLINGVSGGVGTFAVQIARNLGAEVTGVCSTANIELVRSLGARHVTDYTKEDFTRNAGRYDVILDNVLNHPPSATTKALTRSGILIPNSVGNTGSLSQACRGWRAALMGRGPTDVRFDKCVVTRANLDTIATLIESGEVKVVIDKTYPLSEAPAAVAQLLGHRAKGNIAIAQ